MRDLTLYADDWPTLRAALESAGVLANAARDNAMHNPHAYRLHVYNGTGTIYKQDGTQVVDGRTVPRYTEVEGAWAMLTLLDDSDERLQKQIAKALKDFVLPHLELPPALPCGRGELSRERYKKAGDRFDPSDPKAVEYTSISNTKVGGKFVKDAAPKIIDRDIVAVAE